MIDIPSNIIERIESGEVKEITFLVLNRVEFNLDSDCRLVIPKRSYNIDFQCHEDSTPTRSLYKLQFKNYIIYVKYHYSYKEMRYKYSLISNKEFLRKVMEYKL